LYKRQIMNAFAPIEIIHAGQVCNLEKEIEKLEEITWLNEIMQFLREWNSGLEKFELQTSGSTGTPKKIEVSRYQMLVSAGATLKTFDLKPKDKALLVLPAKYIAGKMMLVRALAGKLNLYAIPPSLQIHNIPEGAYDFIALTPAQILLMLSHHFRFEQFKKILVGGAPVSEALLNEMKQINADIRISFGMTETLSHFALARISPQTHRLIYETLPGVTISTDNNKALIVNYPEMGIHQMDTNDRIEYISTTSFYWLGRKDWVINSGGVKISPEQIESKIGHLIVGDFFVASMHDAIFGEIPILIIDKHAQVNDMLLFEIEKILSRIEVPKKIIYTDHFVKTLNEKIDRISTLKSLKK